MNRHDFELLGDKHKTFEKRTEVHLMPGLPIVARLDGRSFSKFTKGLNRPFDVNFITCMQETVKHLIKDFQCDIGYTQSDEITISWKNDSLDNVSLFSGRIQKLTSILSASASVKFNKLLPENLPSKQHLSPLFDCRIFQYTNIQLAAESFLWREIDATRNSLSMSVQHYYSHKKCMGAGFKAKHDMLHAKGVNWNDYPTHFKRGTYFKKVNVERMLTPEELVIIPPEYHPSGPVVRSLVQNMNFEPAESYGDSFASILFGETND